MFDEKGRMLRTDAIITEAAARPALGTRGIISTGTLREGWRAHASEGVQSDGLDRRVAEPRAKDETQRLATSFNARLARWEKSFAQTRRFAADASHELGTLLTIMRSEVELHGGQLRLLATSAPGWTEFEVRLPTDRSWDKLAK